MTCVTSNVFEAQTTVAPTNLWLGTNLANEFGAIGVNDNPNTIFRYPRQHHPIMPTLPFPTGDVSGITSNGDNSANGAADEYFVFDRAGWELAYNNAAYDKIFLAKGGDHFDNRVDDVLTVGGTAQNPRWFIYWDYDLTGADSTADPRPWNQVQADRVQMPWNILSEASYVYFVGLSFGIFPTTSSLSSGRSQRAIWFTRGASDSVVYRCFSTYTGSDGTVIPGSNGSAFKTDRYGSACGDNITWFECVIKDGFVHSSNENEFDHITIQSGNNHKIISCEISDPCNACIQFGPSNTGTGHIVEDCDLFKERRYTSSPANMLDTNSGGTYAQGDAILASKRTMSGGTGPHISDLGNRIWGARPTSSGLDSSPGSGFSLTTSVFFHQEKIEVKYNIIWDSTRRLINWEHNAKNDGTQLSGNTNFTVAYNILADASGQSAAIQNNNDNTEFYRNTIINVLPGQSAAISLYTNQYKNVENFDFMGNFIQDTGDWNPSNIPTNSRYVDCRFGYNAYAGSYQQLNDYHAASTDYIHGSNKTTLNMGNFMFYRKLLTDPPSEKPFNTNDENLITYSDVVPTTDTPEGFLNGTLNADIGSRQGIGVDDETY